jgi:hypothetical protein
MKKFLITERYRLEIRWSKVRYEDDEIAQVDGCYLTGPVLKDANQLSQEDYIDLDFGKQYIILLQDYYITRLAWKGVRYVEDRIELDNVTLTNKHINSIPKLQDGDHIVVDTKNHEDTKHPFHLTYTSYLLGPDGALYDFGR